MRDAVPSHGLIRWLPAARNVGRILVGLDCYVPALRSEVNIGLRADEQTIQELGPKLQVLVLCDECSEY